MSEALVYTVQRLALFAVSLLVFALLGADAVLAVVLAALVSAGLSYVLLRRRRDAVAAKLAEHVQQRAAARSAGVADAETAVEDAAADHLRAERSGSGEPSVSGERSGGKREAEPQE